MLYDYIALGVICSALIVVTVIVSRKFPVVASIKTETLARHRMERLKKGLMESRLKRKLRLEKLPRFFRGGDDGTPPLMSRIHQTLKELEQKYRTRIREIEPSDSSSSEKKKSTLVAEAVALAEQEAYKEAEEKFIEAISIDVKYVEAYEGLAELYQETKDWEHAEETLKYLIKMHEHGDETPVTADLNAAPVSLNREVAEYQTELGEVYRAQSRMAEALDSLQEAAKLEPNNPRILDLLIDTALEVGNTEIAAANIKRLKETNPENEKVKEFQQRLKQVK